MQALNVKPSISGRRPTRFYYMHAIVVSSFSVREHVFYVGCIFCRFYTGASASDASDFANRLLTIQPQVSAAYVQGLFLMHKNEPREMIESLCAQQRQTADCTENFLRHPVSSPA